MDVMVVVTFEELSELSNTPAGDLSDGLELRAVLRSLDTLPGQVDNVLLVIETNISKLSNTRSTSYLLLQALTH